MIDVVIISLTQLAFGFFRTLNVSYTATRNINKTLLTSLGIKITWLIGTYYGVKAVMDTDYLNIAVYLISGLIGDRLSFIVKN